MRLCVRWEPSSPAQKGHSPPSPFSAYVYCGHGRPSQLLLSSCNLPHLYLAPPLWVTPFELSETWAIGYRDYGSCSQHGSRSHDQLKWTSKSTTASHSNCQPDPSHYTRQKYNPTEPNQYMDPAHVSLWIKLLFYRATPCYSTVYAVVACLTVLLNVYM